jgi:ABC-type transporter MlaC component
LAKIPSSDKDEPAEEEEGEEEKGSGEAEKDSKEKDKDSKKRRKRPHGKIGFESLAKVIGKRWQDLEPEQVEHYKKEAEVDMKRYKQEMEVYLGRKDLPEDSAKEADDGDDYQALVSKKLKTDEESVL